MSDAAPAVLPHQKVDGMKSRAFIKSAATTAAVFLASCAALGFDKITGAQWIDLAQVILAAGPAIYGAINVLQRRQSAIAK